VSLPSQASENNIVDSELPEMDRPSILVVFGYCIFLLFKVGDYEYFWFDSYLTFTNRINGLCREVGCPPYNDLDIPFNLQNQYAITSMLSTQTLRFVVASYINTYSSVHPEIGIANLCYYVGDQLCNLSWRGDMRVFTVIHDRLLATNSPVLSDSRVIAEMKNLSETSLVICNHVYFYNFSFLCSASERFHFEILLLRWSWIKEAMAVMFITILRIFQGLILRQFENW
jgi:hypothetical protein